MAATATAATMAAYEDRAQATTETVEAQRASIVALEEAAKTGEEGTDAKPAMVAPSSANQMAPFRRRVISSTRLLEPRIRQPIRAPY